MSFEIVQLMPLMSSFMQRKFGGSSHDKLEVPSIPYHSEIPRILFFGLLGVTYFFLAPLILPFLLVVLCLGYIIYRNQVSHICLWLVFINLFISSLCWMMIIYLSKRILMPSP